MTREQSRLWRESAKQVDYSLDIVQDIAYLYRLVKHRKERKIDCKYFLYEEAKEHNRLVEAIHTHICRKLGKIKNDAKYETTG